MQEVNAKIVIPEDFSYFAIQFVAENRLRFIGPPDVILNDTKRILTSYWGVQEILDTKGLVEIALDGSPWYCSAQRDINVKYFMCALLKLYYSFGFHLKLSTDLQYYGHDSHLLVFEKSKPVDTHVICLSLNNVDLIRILAPESLLAHIRSAIADNWPKGIQKQKKVENGAEFKLKGKPWGRWRPDGEDSYYTPKLMNSIFECLYRHGWIFTSAIDNSKHGKSINSLYFRYEPSEAFKTENKDSTFFAVSLNGTDKLRLYNASNELTQKIKSVVPGLWSPGIIREKSKHGANVLKLAGAPWHAYSAQAVEARKLVGNLLSYLNEQKWSLYATCDLSFHPTKKSTFFFRANASVNTPHPIRTVCMSLNHVDKIRVIAMTEHQIDIVRKAIIQGWPAGIDEERNHHGAWQFQLHGQPFSNKTSSHDSVHSALMMLLVLSSIEAGGMHFFTSADLSAKTEKIGKEVLSQGLHSWYFYEKSE